MVDVHDIRHCNLQLQAPVAAALAAAFSQEAAQGAAKGPQTPDGYGLAGTEQVAAETAALKALLAAQAEVEFGGCPSACCCCCWSGGSQST